MWEIPVPFCTVSCAVWTYAGMRIVTPWFIALARNLLGRTLLLN